jgi:hypothetical protein
MRIVVLQPTIVGGMDLQPSINGQFSNVPDQIGLHLIDIGNARAYVETKVLQVAEKKIVGPTEKKSLDPVSFVSPLDPVLPEQIVKPRRGRPRKSL